MNNSQSDIIIDSLFSPEAESVFIRAVLSNPQQTNTQSRSLIKKVVLRPNGTRIFMESFTKTQAFQKTLSVQEAVNFLHNSLPHEDSKSDVTETTQVTYRQILIETSQESITLLSGNKGITVLRKPIQHSKTSLTRQNSDSLQKATQDNAIVHVSMASPKTPKVMQNLSTLNRQKNYIIKEGISVPFLVYLGIMTSEGKIVSSKYDKFRQINRFLEYIDDILDEVTSAIQAETGDKSSLISGQTTGDKQNTYLPRPLRIADFGCGKSYLTFAVHYFLTEIKHLPVEIAGLDLKNDVIELCNSLASRFKCDGLHFAVGNIADYTGIKPDIVITLHACDTATDFALDYAVKQDAKAILSVPCCQHEVNSQLSLKTSDQVFAPFLKYGIIKERFASLVTDALRAEKLEQANYKVQLLEFIDMTHTPKNILIRAVKKSTTVGTKADTTYDNLCSALNISPSIGRLLNN